MNTYYPSSLDWKTEEEKMDYYSDPNNTVLLNYESKEFVNDSANYSKEDFPKNNLVVQTHATYYVPDEIRNDMVDWVNSILKKLSPDKKILETKNATKKDIHFLLKNYSDYKTRSLLKSTLIPSDQIILHKLSRAFGDPNRPYEKNEVIICPGWVKKYIPKADRASYVLKEWERDWSLEFIRDVDFWNISIFVDAQKHKDLWIEASDNYHLSIEDSLEEKEEKHWYSFMIDEHDTELAKGTLNWMELREEWFPLISLWDLNGISCHPGILESFRRNFAKHLWIDINLIVVNEPFTGWYTTIRHGMWYRQKFESEWKNPNIRNVIQIEYWRFLFNNVRDQITDFDRAKFIWECRRRAMIDVDRDIKSWIIDLWI